MNDNLAPLPKKAITANGSSQFAPIENRETANIQGIYLTFCNKSSALLSIQRIPFCIDITEIDMLPEAYTDRDTRLNEKPSRNVLFYIQTDSDSDSESPDILNKSNTLKFKKRLHTLKSILDSNLKSYRKFLEVKQIYSRLNKNIAKRRAIMTLLHAGIVEDSKKLRKLHDHYQELRKSFEFSPVQSHTEDDQKQQKIAKKRPTETASFALAAPSYKKPSSLTSADNNDNNPLLPGHLMYLLAISHFTCNICTCQVSGSYVMMLTCCRQHICTTCYEKGAGKRCPFCLQDRFRAFNCHTKIPGNLSRQITNCIFEKSSEITIDMEDLDDEIEAITEQAANEFVKTRIDDMSNNFYLAHL